MALLSVFEQEIYAAISNPKDNCVVDWGGIPTSVFKSADHLLTPLISASLRGLFPMF